MRSITLQHVAVNDIILKNNSFKHLVTTTVAEAHN